MFMEFRGKLGVHSFTSCMLIHFFRNWRIHAGTARRQFGP
jgi:hypothetical protein